MFSVQNPSDSELEDRITKIIAEEDEEIIRENCYNFRSSAKLVNTLPLRQSLVTVPVCDKTNSEVGDIDDDELHQLLGVD